MSLTYLILFFQLFFIQMLVALTQQVWSHLDQNSAAILSLSAVELQNVNTAFHAFPFSGWFQSFKAPWNH